MGGDPKKKIIRKFMRRQPLAVISTTGKDCIPEAAVIAFSETIDLEIIFGTFISTRKYKNLKENPLVAIVIGWDAKQDITLQYEGSAKEVGPKEIKKCIAIHTRKNPASKKYATHPEQRFFKITPTWIRYSSLGKENDEIFEVLF